MQEQTTSPFHYLADEDLVKEAVQNCFNIKNKTEKGGNAKAPLPNFAPIKEGNHMAKELLSVFQTSLKDTNQAGSTD